MSRSMTRSSNEHFASHRERVFLQHHLRDPARAAQARIREEAFTDPITCQVEVAQAWHPRTGTSGIAIATNRRQHTNSLDMRQVDTLDQHVAPAWLHRIKQVFQVALIFSRIAQVLWIELLESMDQRPSLWCDT